MVKDKKKKEEEKPKKSGFYSHFLKKSTILSWIAVALIVILFKVYYQKKF